MGDDMFGLYWDEYESVVELRFSSQVLDGLPSPREARRTLEAALRRIPDSDLAGMKSFRIMLSKKTKQR